MMAGMVCAPTVQFHASELCVMVEAVPTDEEKPCFENSPEIQLVTPSTKKPDDDDD